MLKIRLRRMGKRHSPFYRVVVSDSRRVPTASAVDEVGHYDPQPTPPRLVLDLERLQRWKEQGAVLSPTVAKLVKRAESGTVEAAPAAEEAKPARGRKGAAKAEAAKPAAAAAAPAAEATPAAEAEAAPAAAAEAAPAEPEAPPAAEAQAAAGEPATEEAKPAAAEAAPAEASDEAAAADTPDTEKSTEG